MEVPTLGARGRGAADDGLCSGGQRPALEVCALGEAAALGDEEVAVLPVELAALPADAHCPADAEVPEDVAPELAAVVDAVDAPTAPVWPVDAHEVLMCNKNWSK